MSDLVNTNNNSKLIFEDKSIFKHYKSYTIKDIKNKEIITWMFLVFKRLGLYKTKARLQSDDKKAGLLVGLSYEMIKKYRFGRITYKPNKKIIEKIKRLELLLNQDTIKEVTKVNIRRY